MVALLTETRSLVMAPTSLAIRVLGAGIYVASANVTLNAGEIINNTANDQGGAVYVASVLMLSTLITHLLRTTPQLLLVVVLGSVQPV